MLLLSPHLSHPCVDFSHEAQRESVSVLPCPTQLSSCICFRSGVLRNSSLFLFSLNYIICSNKLFLIFFCLLFCSSLEAKRILEMCPSYFILLCLQYMVYHVCVHHTLLSLYLPQMDPKLKLNQCQDNM